MINCAYYSRLCKILFYKIVKYDWIKEDEIISTGAFDLANIKEV